MKQGLIIIFALIFLALFRETFSHHVSETEKASIRQNISEEKTLPTDFSSSSEKIMFPVQDQEIRNPESIGRVPFIVQAPENAWDDPIFQDGCEEASLLMTTAWIEDEALPEPSAVSDAIHALAGFEEGRFGHHEDVNLSELVTVMREYFDHENAHVLSDATLERIVSKIETGDLVLAPSYGRALGNPHFTAPGPVTHMIVLVGYDPASREFIVNDPGTKHGEGYRYDEDILFDAIWAYPPGHTHPTPPEPAERIKSVIIVSRR